MASVSLCSWRVFFQARDLLTLNEKDPKRIFEGNALLRRLTRMGVLDQEHAQLDYVLALTANNFLDRRLQTLVVKLGHAKSMHHARVLIRQRHIKVGNQLVNVPSFMVRLESEKYIAISNKSPYFGAGARPGRTKRKSLKNKKGGAAAEEDDGAFFLFAFFHFFLTRLCFLTCSFLTVSLLQSEEMRK